jgi:probable HAF family extracellular repeat protein
LVGASGAPAGATPAEYEFTLIEAFDVDYDLREVILRDINEAGLVSGTATHNGFYDGFVWNSVSDKTIVPLLWPMGINNMNQIVTDGQIYNFVTGATINVPPAGNYPVPRLQAINDVGTAVGFSECACSNSDRTIQDALLWDAQLGSRTIPVPNAKELLRINNSNVAVGNIRGGSAGSEGFVYNVATNAVVNITDLIPGYLYGRGYSELMDISESGVAVGRGWDGNNVRGLMWSEATGVTYLDALPGGMIDKVFPRGVNASGTVVGWANIAPQTARAFVWDAEHGMRNLNELVVAPPNFILDWAIKINDQGWIIGTGHYGPYWGTGRGFVLKPLGPGSSTDVPALAAVQDFGLRLVPNPVTSRLEVEFNLPSESRAQLSVVDITGREVAQVLDEWMPAGNRRVHWEPSSMIAAGVYFVRLETPDQIRSKRFVLVR